MQGLECSVRCLHAYMHLMGILHVTAPFLTFLCSPALGENGAVQGIIIYHNQSLVAAVLLCALHQSLFLLIYHYLFMFYICVLHLWSWMPQNMKSPSPNNIKTSSTPYRTFFQKSMEEAIQRLDPSANAEYSSSFKNKTILVSLSET